MASQGTVPVYELVQGATLPKIKITYAVNGSAPAFASAQFSVAKGEDVFFTAACTLSNGTGTKDVTTPGASPLLTRNWPLGTLTWNVETVADDGTVKDWVKGTYLILRTDQP